MNKIDCVEMKREGAKKVRETTEKLTRQEENFWKSLTDDLRKKEEQKKAI